MEKESRWRFILFRGVFLWGYPTGLIAKSIELFPPSVHLPRFTSLAEVAIFLIVWAVGGIAFGTWMWNQKKKSCELHHEEAPEAS
jgi:uncharacterized membrane protein YidH (DUF202 family)